MPHGHCYLWQPNLVWTMFIADGLIGISYVVISATLYTLVRRSRVPFEFIFLAFGAFILACGLTHFMEIYTLWYPGYWLAAGVKVVTAVASVVTAIYLVKVFPKIFEITETARELARSRSKVEDLFFRHLATPPEIKSMLRQIVTLPMLLVVGLIAVSIFQANYLRVFENRVDHSTDIILHAQKLRGLAKDSEQALLAFWVGQVPEEEEKANRNEQEFETVYYDLENLVGNNDIQMQKLKAIHTSFYNWRDFKHKSLSTDGPKSNPNLKQFYLENSHLSSDITQTFEDFIQSERDVRAAQGETTRTLASVLIVSVCVLSLMIGAVFAIFGRNALFQASNSYARVLESEKLTQEKLRNAVSARDEFFSMASHELKTPLTSLKLQLQILDRNVQPNSKNLPTPEQLTQSFDLALRQVNTLSDLVEDMLDTSRIQTGNFVLELNDIDLSELVTDVLNRLKGQLKTAGSTVNFNLKPGVVGHWDRHRLEQVVVNLMTNAMKYAPRSTINIYTSHDGAKARLVVEDFGPGIEVDKREKIFDRFERLEAHRAAGGLGLGLFIVRKIVEAHGGTVHVESELGKGSRFVVQIPSHNHRYTARSMTKEI